MGTACAEELSIHRTFPPQSHSIIDRRIYGDLSPSAFILRGGDRRFDYCRWERKETVGCRNDDFCVFGRRNRFLSVKKWLLRKKHQVELARKRGWRGYWVCLKGTTLLFYPCDSREGRHVEAAPKHLIIVDGAIMQPIPEHPQRDFIFCLSTAFGDAYLFQVYKHRRLGAAVANPIL